MHWVVPKGAPNAKLAMEAINYALSPEAEARLLESSAPTGPCSANAATKGTPEQRKVLGHEAAENIKNMLILNEQQAALYSAKYTNDWDRMQLGDRRHHGVLARRAAVSRHSSALAASRNFRPGRVPVRANAPGNDMMRMIRRGGFAGVGSRGEPWASRDRGLPLRAGSSPICPPRPISSSCRSGTSGWRRRSAAPSRAARKPPWSSPPASCWASAMIRSLAASLALRLELRFPSRRPNCMGFYSDLTTGVWVCGFPSLRQPAPKAGSRSSPIPAASSARSLAQRSAPALRARRLPRGERRPRRSPIISPMRSSGRR